MQAQRPARDGSEKGSGLLPFCAWALAAVWTTLWFMHTRWTMSQAGYLHLAFARSLARDEGFGVQGRAVFGDASPLWIALLALAHRLLQIFTPDWRVTGKALAASAALFFAAGLYGFAQRLFSSIPAAPRRAAPAMVVLVIVLSPYWGLEAFSGTEVLAAAGVACWGCALVAGPLTAGLRPRRLLAACLCAGCGPLLRPEMLFLSVCLAPFVFVRWANTPLRFRVKLLVFFTGLLFALGPGAWWLLYTVRRFGTALPDTIGAGVARAGVSVLWQGIERVGVGAPWLPAAVAGLGVWLARWYLGRRRDPAVDSTTGWSTTGWAQLAPVAWLPIVWTALVTAFYLATQTAVTSRDVLLLAPACTASVFAVASLSLPRFAPVAWLGCAVYGVAAGLLFAWPAVPVELARERVFADLAQALRGLPPNEPVALAPVSEVLFLSVHPVVDLGGALDSSALAFRWDVTDARRVWWAHGRGARAMLLDHSPEPGSVAVWSRDLPAEPWMAGEPGSGPGGSHTFDRLTLWQLPPSPTLPPPADLPEHPE